jgi:hypothetical protein
MREGVGAASGGRNLKKLENTVFLLYPISPPKSRVWGNFHEKTIRPYDMGTGGRASSGQNPFWENILTSFGANSPAANIARVLDSQKLLRQKKTFSREEAFWVS